MSKLLKLSLYNEGKILVNAEHITKVIQSEFNENTTIIKMAGSNLDEVIVTESIEEIEALMLRDQFAMSALNGLLSNSGGVVQANNYSGTGYANGSAEYTALWAYELADAMLKARKE